MEEKMDFEPLISIIVPIFNAEKYLKECLESIINQTYKNIEILLINDGSSDSSLDMCKPYAIKDERIVLYTQRMEEFPLHVIEVYYYHMVLFLPL